MFKRQRVFSLIKKDKALLSFVASSANAYDGVGFKTHFMVLAISLITKTPFTAIFTSFRKIEIAAITFSIIDLHGCDFSSTQFRHFFQPTTQPLTGFSIV